MYNSSWPEIQRLLLGWGWEGGGGSGADLASTLLTSRIVYVYFTKCRRAGRSVCADDKWRHWYNRTATY